MTLALLWSLYQNQHLLLWMEELLEPGKITNEELLLFTDEAAIDSE